MRLNIRPFMSGKDVGLGTEQEILVALRGSSLAERRNLLDAIPQRFALALEEAARLLEPKQRRYRTADADAQRRTPLAPRIDQSGGIGTGARHLGRVVQHAVFAFSARVSDTVPGSNNNSATALSSRRLTNGEHYILTLQHRELLLLLPSQNDSDRSHHRVDVVDVLFLEMMPWKHGWYF
ncbi:hypothetical protein [Nitrospira sp. Nam80]